MRTSHKLTHLLLLLLALSLSAIAVSAQNSLPGAPSDQKAGSLLFYNIYTSNLNNLGGENTRFNLTNTGNRYVAIHMFFVDGSTCTIADTFVCLTPNQTMSFLASDYDPGVTGYMFAVAIDQGGLPLDYDYLIGDLYFKKGIYQANLGAEAFEAHFEVTGPHAHPSDPNSAPLAYGVTGTGNCYDFSPTVVALDNIPSPDRGNTRTLLILNSIQGTTAAAGRIGTLSGLLFDDAEVGYSFQIRGLGCQVVRELSDDFPRTAKRFSTVIPSGRTGWMKFSQVSTDSSPDIVQQGLLGAMIVGDTRSTTNAAAFNGGHNLHKLTVKDNPGFLIPIFTPPTC